MRYSKWSLLLFGAGLALGLAVVAAELHGLARLASLAMAAGIALLPVALVADLRHRVAAAARRKLPPTRTRRTSATRPGSTPRRATAARRPRRKRP